MITVLVHDHCAVMCLKFVSFWAPNWGNSKSGLSVHASHVDLLFMSTSFFWVMPILVSCDHFFIVWNVLGHRKCVSRGKQTNTRRRKTQKAQCPAQGAFADLRSQSHGLSDIRRREGRILDLWTPGSGLESRGNPCRAARHWQGKPGESHLLAKKGNRKCVYLSLGRGKCLKTYSLE